MGSRIGGGIERLSVFVKRGVGEAVGAIVALSGGVSSDSLVRDDWIEHCECVLSDREARVVRENGCVDL